MNVPKLRFKEFNDEIKEYEISDILEIKNGLNKEKEEFGFGTPIINYMDVNKKELIFSKNIKGLVNANQRELESFKVKKGDIFFTRTSETSDEIGLSASVMDDIDNCVYSGFILKASQKENILNPVFSGYYFRNPRMRNEIIKHSSITTRALTSGTLLGQMKVFIPSYKEQDKIGKTLYLLDKKIELQTKKIEDLKLFKKGLLILKFSNEIKNIELEEIIKKGKAGGTPKSTVQKYYNGTIPFLSISDISSQNKYIKHTEKCISEDGLKNSSTWLVPKNSIILSMYASYGLPCINKIKLATSQAMYSMIFKDDIDVEFIYYYLYYLQQINYYDRLVSTGTQSNLNAEKVNKIKIYCPNYDIQKNISKSFVSCDKKILLEENKLLKLQDLKKGLMQSMFV